MKIKFVLSEVRDDTTATWVYDDVTEEWIERPGVPFKAYNMLAVVNGEVLTNTVVDVVSFAHAWKTGKDTDTTVFTCTCGDAGCAGYFDNFVIRKEGDKFVVTIKSERDEDTKVEWDRFEVDLDTDFAEMIEQSKGPAYEGAYNMDFSAIYDELPEWKPMVDLLEEQVTHLIEWKARTSANGETEE